MAELDITTREVNGLHDISQTQPTLDPQLLKDYLSRLLTSTLGASIDELEGEGGLLSPDRISDTIKSCTEFLQGPEVGRYIQKNEISNASRTNGANTSTEPQRTKISYSLSSNASVDPNTISSLAILKGPRPIDLSRPLAEQLQIVNLPGLHSIAQKATSHESNNASFDLIYSIVHSALAPYFDALSKSQDTSEISRSKGYAEQRLGIPGAKKKFAELELSLLQLQQNAEIPQISFPMHPRIQDILDTARHQEVTPSLDLITSKDLNNSVFLNELQTRVNEWIKSIQTITKADRDPANGTAGQEIRFWLDLEKALAKIEKDLESDGVQLTVSILKNAKRHAAQFSFVADTGFRDSVDLVQKYNQLLRDFPLDDLNSAVSLERLQNAVDVVFAHINRKLRVCPYPIRRALPLVEAISGDLDARVHNLVDGRSLMQMTYRDFESVINATSAVWSSWDENVKDFTNVARELMRRRNERFIPIKINPRHIRTQERLRYIATFRSNHEQLQRTIQNVLRTDKSSAAAGDKAEAEDTIAGDDIGDFDAVQEVAEAYSDMKNINVLDVSESGTQTWERAETIYNERTERVENSIIARLRDRLATAKTANEMFRVFSKFNALFVRPKIRSAISEYQTQLIENVKQDISALQDRFKQQYGRSQAHAMAQLRDLPPVSGAIIWARQIERQLDGYMKKVEDVLGTQWDRFAEGQNLQNESENFRKKLDTKPIFQVWIQDVNRRNISISGRLFNISRNRAAGNILELSVNFDAHVITLFKEVRNLLWLGFSIPHSINNAAKEARRVYPFAVSLVETVRTFLQTMQAINNIQDSALLLNGYCSDVLSHFARGIPLKWESFSNAYNVNARQISNSLDPSSSALIGSSGERHMQFVKDLARSVSTLQTKTAYLAEVNDSIQATIIHLRTCPYTFEAFQKQISDIQKSVDRLSLENYANLHPWVKQINATIENILLQRLEKALIAWSRTFEKKVVNTSEDQADVDIPTLETLVHEILLRDQTIYLEPPLDFARCSWLAKLHQWLGNVCDLPKIQASRYEIKLYRSGSTTSTQTFADLLLKCSDKLLEVYRIIDAQLGEVEQYIDRWLQFQSLWDLQSDSVYDSLGDDLALWLQLLNEIRKARSTFDTAETTRTFGLVSIDYDQVQMKINAKYDLWQNDVLQKFSAKLGGRVAEVYADIERTRKDLESSSLESSSTTQAVNFITLVQNASSKVNLWGPEIETFRQGQTTLSRQRYPFPQDWLPVERIEHEWSALNEILERKSKLVADQTDALRARITAEDRVMNEKIEDIKAQWKEQRPVSGTIPPDEASNTLATFESKLGKLNTDFEMMSKAKEALDLPPTKDSGLDVLIEEIQDFKSVWAALSTIWKGLDELRDLLWTSVQPRKIRQSLENLINMSKDMPSRMRQYQAFEHLQSVLRQLVKVNPILAELRSEAVRERHWQRIFKELKPSSRYSQVSMTLGDVWDLKPAQSEPVIRDVISQAQGELALEEFLKQVREEWQNYSLDLVNYHNKCRLIRGWDDLFSKCSEHLNSLQAMHFSPYFKEFEEEASLWEDKLNRTYVLFDVWIDVQRQWVYLEGVFSGNADIKHLLPMESSRFQNINSEFFSVMKKVQRSPFVLDVLGISGVQKSLERLLDLLNKIQKALGEYLERERLSFPRFYFVGDEDLLEIIGNGNDTNRIARHLGKMFAGISALEVTEDAEIIGFRSSQGEEVMLKKSISLTKTPKINEWLSALEINAKATLAELLAEAVEAIDKIFTETGIDFNEFETVMEQFPAQIVVLAGQVWWTTSVESVVKDRRSSLEQLLAHHKAFLEHLASVVINELEPVYRKKCEHFITEFVYQRDIIEKLISHNVDSTSHPLWLLQMRYDYIPEGEYIDRLQIKMADASLVYGFEYLGVVERLVRTPLTDQCFLTMTQALNQRLGGSPYGPAGTGKTETVKALGLQLGRFTLVFNCDDSFDFQAMGRIFLGICQVGAWGCFDEFNRLEERILSAVSQQVQNIQLGLKHSAVDEKAQIELVGRQLKVNPCTGIFITMNPGYAGRSNLPDNLKKLFRSVAMSKPDKELIAEVTLYAQGFSHAREISRQTVPFFDACLSRLSKQAHYDFGLRALKSVLISSGGLKRNQNLNTDKPKSEIDEAEPQIILQSVRETIGPKLILEDAQKMEQIEAEIFPGIKYVPAPLVDLKAALTKVAEERNMILKDAWMTKAVQLYQIQQLHHGVMMVGSSGSGKSATWTALLKALQEVEGVEGISYVIDPKVMSKEALYGTLDSTTREWTDGLFTSILRKIVDNLRGEATKRHWIIFDGDVDPEWVENLNSVLDDNKLLTLPNGERLVLPPNVRILFEVESLKYATLATVSRCGMVWFNEDNVTLDMMISQYLSRLQATPFEDVDEDNSNAPPSSTKTLAVQKQMAEVIEEHFANNGFLVNALKVAMEFNHIMTFTAIRALNTFFSLINKACKSILEYDAQHTDFPLQPEQIQSYISKQALLAIAWSFAGDCPLGERQEFSNRIAKYSTHEFPSADNSTSLIDFSVSLPDANWSPWQQQVPNVEVNTHSVTQTDVVIPTIDTIRHEEVLYSWLAEHKPLILCGPPGSGKTMTLFSALRKLPGMEVVGLNFSSATTPDLLLKSFEQYCEYRKTLNGVTLSPSQVGRWLVIFCDEINLPALDKYGTQRVISFLRQLVEYNGFWRTSDKTWVSLERIQFVGACNPPTDAGRVPLGLRFLRHVPLVMVDYPGEHSLSQIYGAFNSAVLKITPSLRGYSSALTQAMVQLYGESKAKFTPQVQPHYIYSPRELTRWVRGVYEAIKPLETLDLEGLVRIWAHEALRLFQDRLIEEEERRWTNDAIHRIALEHFPTIDEKRALAGPILFSNWLSKNYVPVDREQLRDYVKARLRTFCEEEIDVPLVLYDDALDHVLRIDRVFRQPQGHVILIGVSGSGKTTLSRFVAWMNGLKVFQIKVHGKYTAEDFDEDLRGVLRRCGTKGEKICFIMDESNVLDSAFLERMNTLLANAEVPGLFEGDEYASLMTACKEGAQRQGLLLDSQDELYKWFTQQVISNLHVVFTMNPPEEGLSAKAATSPALFNRCVLNWFGDWSDHTFFHVGSELTQSLDLDRANYVAPDSIPLGYRDLPLPPSHRGAVINAMVYIHQSLHGINKRLQRQQNKQAFLTPRHFLDFVAQFSKLYNEKREDLEEQQRHLNVGLDKLRETVEKVRDLRKSLAGKKGQLEAKDKEANEKLQRMINDQQQAEQQKATSLEIQSALEKQEKEVASRKEVVLKDLANAEPAVLEAQKSVSNIKKQQLTEVRSMTSPPAGVKLALEAVCTLLGHKVGNWKDIQAIVRRDDFIASIVNYDNEKQMTPTHRTKMRNEFLNNEDFTYDRVNRASKACGPLVQWVAAQVNYSEILDRVGPLREEVGQLEEQALQTKAEAQAIENKIKELEASIAVYKAEYASLISETQAIKNEMERVQQKVDRSLHLLDSLASERKRWEEGSKLFETQIETIVGDTLSAAAFITYAGFYDQQFRKIMLEDWLHQLSLSGIKFKSHNTITEYLSTADERLEWQQNALPVDDLCTENAIMLKRFNRYPLIIDPSGRTVEFLQNEHKDRRLLVTSFLDDNFIKQVESALRFGNSILIQDAEYLDPVLNHVLNREYQKTGGRILIQLGKQEIDFSPSFRLYLLTRDPSVTFSPDICSRTTFINFTVTQSSLQTQSLNDVLRSERPDVDERRSNLIKIQGEFRIRLRRLEQRLLQALNESQGNILDDDAVIQTLENLKKEVGEITAKVNETEGVMAEVEKITSEYKVVAQTCSAIFAVFEQLRHINHFYQFSLQYFVDIFEAVLQSAKQSGTQATDYKARVDLIIRSLFVTAYRRTAISLLQKDRTALALLLAQAAPYDIDKRLFDSLLDEDVPFHDAFTEDKDRSDLLNEAKRISLIKNDLESVNLDTWNSVLSYDLAEKQLPTMFKEKGKDSLNAELRGLILTKAVRADRLVPAAEQFVLKAFGNGLLDVSSDLNELIDQISASTPIALCCSPGFDASFRVDNVVEQRQSRCANIAMGSVEGLGGADKAISEAAAAGTWVYIKNVHLALTWLQSLEKRLDALKPHPNFRLFLSMECNPKIPVNLLRTSRVVMCEQPAGIRANMKDTLPSNARRANKPPVERKRAYLLLSLLHGIIQERLRYAPKLGWTASWEFNDSDYDCSAHVLDTWIAWAAGGRANVAPTSIPWSMIRALVAANYGGKIDSDADAARLRALIAAVLNPATYDEAFDVVRAVAVEGAPAAQPDAEQEQRFVLPGGTRWEEFEAWVNALPEHEPPALLGLPANAEKILLVEQGKEMLRNVGRVMRILDETELVMAEAAAEEAG